jgi:hypothetical protein
MGADGSEGARERDIIVLALSTQSPSNEGTRA